MHEIIRILMKDILKIFELFMKALGIIILFGGSIILIPIYIIVYWMLATVVVLIPLTLVSEIFSIDSQYILNIAGGLGVIVLIGFYLFILDYDYFDH